MAELPDAFCGGDVSACQSAPMTPLLSMDEPSAEPRSASANLVERFEVVCARAEVGGFEISRGKLTLDLPSSLVEPLTIVVGDLAQIEFVSGNGFSYYSNFVTEQQMNPRLGMTIATRRWADPNLVLRLRSERQIRFVRRWHAPWFGAARGMWGRFPSTLQSVQKISLHAEPSHQLYIALKAWGASFVDVMGRPH